MLFLKWEASHAGLINLIGQSRWAALPIGLATINFQSSHEELSVQVKDARGP